MNLPLIYTVIYRLSPLKPQASAICFSQNTAESYVKDIQQRGGVAAFVTSVDVSASEEMEPLPAKKNTGLVWSDDVEGN